MTNSDHHDATPQHSPARVSDTDQHHDTEVQQAASPAPAQSDTTIEALSTPTDTEQQQPEDEARPPPEPLNSSSRENSSVLADDRDWQGDDLVRGGSVSEKAPGSGDQAFLIHNHYMKHDTLGPDAFQIAPQTPENAESSELADMPQRYWEALAMKRHPDVLEFRERLLPLSGGVSYARLREVGRTEVKETLSSDRVLQLVMQHLTCAGYTGSRQALSTESGLPYEHIPSNESLLLPHLCMAVESTDKIHERATVEDREDWKDAEMEQLRQLGRGGFEDEQESDVNNEPETPETITRGEHNELRAGTLNQIVREITSPKEVAGDIRVLTRACLLTYWSFTTLERLLQKLMDRFMIEPTPAGADPAVTTVVTKEEVTQIRLRVLNILKQWLNDYSYDFTDKVMQMVNSFVRNRISPINKTWASSLEDLRSTRKPFQPNPELCPDPKVNPRNICSPTLTWQDLEEEEIARQLSLLDFADYSAIRPIELLGLAWSKPSKRHRSPNVLRVTVRFNFLAGWAAKQIMDEPRLRDRARVMSKIMKLILCLAKLNNFTSAFALIAALGEASIARLRATLAEVSAPLVQQFESIKKTLSQQNNFKEYRDHLKIADPPCVPYLGVYQSDLTFMDQGNKDFLPNGQINFNKSLMVSRVISEIMLYQQKGYNFHAVPQIQSIFTLPDLSLEEMKKKERAATEELYEKSLQYEPRVPR